MKNVFRKIRYHVFHDAVRGVLTIEMAYLMGVILTVFVLIMYTVFYYHDKNILIGAASETAVVGTQSARKPDVDGQTDLSGFYQERIRGKLIFFPGAQAEVSVSSAKVEVTASAAKGFMKLQVVQRAFIKEPEKKIRQKKILETMIGEGE